MHHTTRDDSPEDITELAIQFRDVLPKDVLTTTPDVFKYPEWTKNDQLIKIGEVLRTFFKANPRSVVNVEKLIQSSLMIQPSEIKSSVEFFQQNSIIRHYTLDSSERIAEAQWLPRINEIIHYLVSEQVAERDTVRELTPIPDGVAQEEPTGDCSAIMSDGSSCGRPAFRGDKCICHSSAEDKPLEQFSEAVNETLACGDLHDFTRFVFPDHFAFQKGLTFNYKSIFDFSVFNCVLLLDDVTLKSDASLSGCVFNKGLVFRLCHFEDVSVEAKNMIIKGDCEITISDFGILDMNSCVFERRASFRSNSFKDRINLSECRFMKSLLIRDFKREGEGGNISLARAVFENPQSTHIKTLYFPQIILLGCDVKGISITTPVVTSNKSDLRIGDDLALKYVRLAFPRWFARIKGLIRALYNFIVRGRPQSANELVHDVVPHSQDFSRRNFEAIRSLVIASVQSLTGRKMGTLRQRYLNVIECYQRLQSNMNSSKNYEMAGAFHAREMDLRREMHGPFGQWLLSKHALYMWLAYYCERIWVPILVLILVICALAPIVTMLWMGDPTFSWTGNLDHIRGAFDGWLDHLTRNLRSIFFMQDGVFCERFESGCCDRGWYLFLIGEKLFTVVMLSFIVVAFRRHFKRF